MNKTVVGIDISKVYFDVFWRRDDGREEQQRYTQDVVGYAALVFSVPGDNPASRGSP